MTHDTNINWTHRPGTKGCTWNPIIGCSKVSAGCANCYAEKMAAGRLAKIPGQTGDRYRQVVTDGKWNGKTAFVPEVMEKPLRWRKPRTIFVGSMTDIFHETVKDEWLDQIFAAAALCPQHTFILCTKRPERMAWYINNSKTVLAHWVDEISDYHAAHVGLRWPLPNVWTLVSVEDQATADKRLLYLLETDSAVRGVSLEPMLGAVDLFPYFWPQRLWRDSQIAYAEKAHEYSNCEIPRLDWVICGGESGPNARPMHPDWARSVRDQCAEAGVPFFFKQWGEWKQIHELEVNNPDIKGRDWLSFDPDVSVCRVGKHAAGRLLDGREWNEWPGGAEYKKLKEPGDENN